MAGSQATRVDSTLSRQLQAISAGGWANIQTPVREGFEAVEITTNGLAEQLSASREDVRRLEARLVGMEEMVRFNGSGDWFVDLTESPCDDSHGLKSGRSRVGTSNA